ALPAQGKTVTATVHARANESDPNTSNNSNIENTSILPDGNAAPAVEITTPTVGALFVGPANIGIDATATDGDGTVSSVNFYGDGNLIGTAVVSGTNQYSLTWSNVTFGPHSIIAVATDNLGKISVSDEIVIKVNGAASVSITAPTWWAGTFNAPV